MGLHIKKPVTHFEFWKINPQEIKKTRIISVNKREVVNRLISALSEDMKDFTKEIFVDPFGPASRYTVILFSDKEAILSITVIYEFVISDDHYYCFTTRSLWDFLEELKEKMGLEEKKIVMKGRPRFVTVKEV